MIVSCFFLCYSDSSSLSRKMQDFYWGPKIEEIYSHKTLIQFSETDF